MGHSFGIPYEHYAKVHIKGVNTRADQIPGPGTYPSKSTIGGNSPKFTLKGKLREISNFISLSLASATKEIPPCTTYSPLHSQTEYRKFHAVTFGIGDRPNVTGSNFSKINFRACRFTRAMYLQNPFCLR
jgi:hypothetical protein